MPQILFFMQIFAAFLIKFRDVQNLTFNRLREKVKFGLNFDFSYITINFKKLFVRNKAIYSKIINEIKIINIFNTFSALN